MSQVPGHMAPSSKDVHLNMIYSEHVTIRVKVITCTNLSVPGSCQTREMIEVMYISPARRFNIADATVICAAGTDCIIFILEN